MSPGPTPARGGAARVSRSVGPDARAQWPSCARRRHCLPARCPRAVAERRVSPGLPPTSDAARGGRAARGRRTCLPVSRPDARALTELRQAGEHVCPRDRPVRRPARARAAQAQRSCARPANMSPGPTPARADRTAPGRRPCLPARRPRDPPARRPRAQLHGPARRPRAELSFGTY